MSKDLERLIRGLFAAYRLVKKFRKAHAKKHKLEAVPEVWQPVPPLRRAVPRERPNTGKG